MESALDHIRALGRWDQHSLVSSICDIYCDLNGNEPATEELHGIFGRIKECFAEEAREEFLEVRAVDGDEEEDEDYMDGDDVGTFSFFQDRADDVYKMGEHDAVSTEDEDEDEDASSMYSPERDPFDYSVDVEDDLDFESEEESEEESDA